MNMMADKDYVVPFSDFVKKLQQQHDYQLEGGTIYRQRTAELSLEVAYKVQGVTPFYNNTETKRVVAQLLPELDLDRREDVAKMLSVVINRLHLNATLSVEVKEHVKQKMSSQKIRLIKEK